MWHKPPSAVVPEPQPRAACATWDYSGQKNVATTLTHRRYHLHLQHSRLDALFPVTAKSIDVFLFPMCIQNTAARRDQCAATIDEGGSRHLGRRSLRAVPGEQEHRLRQSRAQTLHRLRLRRHQHGADCAKILSLRRARPRDDGFEPISQHLRPGSAVSSFASCSSPERDCSFAPARTIPCRNPGRSSRTARSVSSPQNGLIVIASGMNKSSDGPTPRLPGRRGGLQRTRLAVLPMSPRFTSPITSSPAPMPHQSG